MEYQRFYFENKLTQKNIENLNFIKIEDEKLIIEKMIETNE